jgi:hypothetical protein
VATIVPWLIIGCLLGARNTTRSRAAAAMHDTGVLTNRCSTGWSAQRTSCTHGW